MNTWKYVFAQIGRGWWIWLSGAALVGLAGLWEGTHHPSIVGYLLFLVICFCAGIGMTWLTIRYTEWRERVRMRRLAARLEWVSPKMIEAFATFAQAYVASMPTLDDVAKGWVKRKEGDSDATE